MGLVMDDALCTRMATPTQYLNGHNLYTTHWLDSWQYAMKHRIDTTKLFSTTASTLRHALGLCTVDGLCMNLEPALVPQARILQETNSYPSLPLTLLRVCLPPGTPFPKGPLNWWIRTGLR